MKPCPSRERLGQFLGHQLTGLHRTALMAHVEECSACQSILEELTRDAAFESWRLRNDASGGEDQPGAEFLRRLKETRSDEEGR
jgi:hypothetical protein